MRVAPTNRKCDPVSLPDSYERPTVRGRYPLKIPMDIEARKDIADHHMLHPMTSMLCDALANPAETLTFKWACDNSINHRC